MKREQTVNIAFTLLVFNLICAGAHCLSAERFAPFLFTVAYYFILWMYHSSAARLPILEDSGWQQFFAIRNGAVIDILLISWFLPVWLWERCPEISPTSFETQCHNIPENGRSIIYLIRSSLMYWVLTYCVEDPAQETRGTETRERRLLCVHLFSPPAGVCGQPALWKVLEVRLGSPRGTAS